LVRLCELNSGNISLLSTADGKCGCVTDYVAENKTITLTIPTQGSTPVVSIFDWIVWMQRDVASGFNWNLTWADYKNGFGSYDALDYWMGLERLHLLTTSGSYRLRLEWQETTNDYWLSVEYWLFYIEDEAAKYKLHVSGYVHGDDGRALYVCDAIRFLALRDNVINVWKSNSCPGKSKPKTSSQSVHAFWHRSRS